MIPSFLRDASRECRRIFMSDASRRLKDENVDSVYVDRLEKSMGRKVSLEDQVLVAESCTVAQKTGRVRERNK